MTDKLRKLYKNWIQKVLVGIKLPYPLGRFGADPDFLILGIQHGGTSSAVQNLNLHPMIRIVSREVHYFDRKYFLPHWWYKNHFVRNDRGLLNGETTPVYLSRSHAMERIHRHYPQMKLVMLLREPIQRAFSKWTRRTRKGTCTRPFIPSVLESEGNILRNGFYADHLEYILTMFPRENLHIAISEQVRQQPALEYNRIVKFLGLSEHPFEDLSFKGVSHYGTKLSHSDVSTLLEVYEPHNARLYELLGGEIPEWQEFYAQHGVDREDARAGNVPLGASAAARL
jgi:hypothetical protein